MLVHNGYETSATACAVVQGSQNSRILISFIFDTSLTGRVRNLRGKGCGLLDKGRRLGRKKAPADVDPEPRLTPYVIAEGPLTGRYLRGRVCASQR